ncbi:hypothetical protein B7463_g12649, partial [Scytalidium lignicola]
MRYLKNAMRKSKQRRPPSIYLPTTKDGISSRSSVISDCDADDEGFMSGGDAQPSRPLSLTIPGGPYCPRRPTLREVLADESSPPWTLSAFMQYLSQNHCLETLEFTMDASRYGKHYQAMIDRDPQTPLSPQTQDCGYVRMLWQKLLDAYIAQNSPREVNLPSEVRDELVSLPNTFIPPHPSHLDQAVKIIYELMDESVLVPFLNSVAPPRGVSDSYSNPWTSDDSMMMDVDERSLSPSQSRERDQSPPGAVADGSPSRPSQHLSPPSSRLSRLSANLSYSGSGSGSGSSSAVDGIESLTDDSGDSPMASAMEPMTPPTTPPQSDVGFSGFSPNSSPRNSRNEGTSGWKKVTPLPSESSSASTPVPIPAPILAPESAPAKVHSADVANTSDAAVPVVLSIRDTTLRPSDGGLSPLLEAHPGSPVDLTHRRTSTVTSLGTIRASELDRAPDRPMSARSPASAGSNKEEDFRRGAVAAKPFDTINDNKDDHNNGISHYGDAKSIRSMSESIHIPLKAPSQVEIRTIPSLASLCSDDRLSGMSIDTTMEICPDLGGDEDLQTWISNLSPKHILSRNSISTANSTLCDDRSIHGDISRFPTGSSALSTSSESIFSTTTVTDMYGWEEELERQVLEKHRTAIDERRRSIGSGVGLGIGPIEFLEPNWGPPGAERTVARQMRIPVQRHLRGDRSRERVDGGKRKSLLYRVLNISPSSHGPTRGSPVTSPTSGCGAVGSTDGIEARDHICHYPNHNPAYDRR